MYPSNPTHDTDESHFSVPDEPFRNYNHQYASGLIKVFFSSTINSKRAAFAIPVNNVDFRSLLKDGYCMVVIERTPLTSLSWK